VKRRADRIKRTGKTRGARSLWRSLAASLCVFALCAAQLLSSAHMALVEHVRCAEHGEWEHVGEHHGTSDIAHQATLETSSTAATNTPTIGSGLRHDASVRSVFAAAELDEAHGHDHCAFCFDRRRLILTSPFVAADAPVGIADAMLRVAVRSWTVSKERYSIAPKNSPPV